MAAETISMRELVEYIAKALVDDPSKVRVEEVSGPNSTILELHVAPEDVGRIIGRNGRIINSMRTLLRVMAVRQGKRVVLELV
jgi:predicted RNA-binding protein YlqC (UPF0109 family)